MRMLFWNTYRNNDINSYVINLVEQNNIDVLILSEYTGNLAELNEFLKQSKKSLYKWNTNGCTRLHIWGNYVDITPGEQNSYFSIQIVNKKYILCGVHMYSNLHGEHCAERTTLAEDIMYAIKQVRDIINSNNVIVIGDINESPYENTCLSVRGFHALPALSISDKNTRTIFEKEYEKMYNPMWNLFGDFEYPPGTYYLTESKSCIPCWYMLDQVIISQPVIPLLVREGLKIITECGSVSLHTNKGYPNKNISDHFPIMCEFNI